MTSIEAIYTEFFNKLQTCEDIRSKDFQVKASTGAIDNNKNNKIKKSEQITSYLAITSPEFLEFLKVQSLQQGKGEGDITVIVKALKGQEYKYQLSKTESVTNLKKLVENQSGCPVARIRLIFKGKALKDDANLEESKVTDDAKLFMVLKSDAADELTSALKPATTPGQSGAIEIIGDPVTSKVGNNNNNNNNKKKKIAEHIIDYKINVTTDEKFWTTLHETLSQYQTKEDADAVMSLFQSRITKT